MKGRRGIALLAVLLSACASGGGPGPSGGVPRDELVVFDERLGVDDVFTVRVVGEPDLTGEFRVGVDGTIDYPYLGRLKILGKSPGEVQQEITRMLKDGYIRSPQVNILVKELNSRKIVVLGQVQKPGPVVYFPRMTIVDTIAAAGGFTEIAAKNTVRVRRERNGKVLTNNYRVADISEGRQPNVVMLPGDVVVVEERMF
jgi:protein involved in polysaccharide export with SLBB domain